MDNFADIDFETAKCYKTSICAVGDMVCCNGDDGDTHSTSFESGNAHNLRIAQ